MLKALYRDKTLIPEKPIDLRDGTSVVLQVIPAPPAGLMGFLTLTKVRAVYERGAFMLRRPLEARGGSEVTIFAFSATRPLASFQGLLRHLNEDSVSLQHKAREWWGQSAP